MRCQRENLDKMDDKVYQDPIHIRNNHVHYASILKNHHDSYLNDRISRHFPLTHFSCYDHRDSKDQLHQESIH